MLSTKFMHMAIKCSEEAYPWLDPTPRLAGRKTEFVLRVKSVHIDI